eukprot:4583696-Amphidinium_carterae.1
MLGEMWEQASRASTSSWIPLHGNCQSNMCYLGYPNLSKVRKEPDAGTATSPSQTPHASTPPPCMLDDLRKLVTLACTHSTRTRTGDPAGSDPQEWSCLEALFS